MSNSLRSIAVLTSGGDAPGLNACLRAVVMTGIHFGLRVVGVHDGYEGLIDGTMEELVAESVSGIIQRGGTILKSSRSLRFTTVEGRVRAFEQMQQHAIDALVVIGGDGSFCGARALLAEHPLPIVAIPKTIDNDIAGTDVSIGYDTACNTAMEAMDKIRDTAESHNKIFFVEVMGRDAGFIAYRTGLSIGAEAIYIPESRNDLDHLYSLLERGWDHLQHSIIVVVAEGDEAGGAVNIAKQVSERFPRYDTRVSILGHVQRGGSPSCADRVLASKLGMAAVQALIEGKSGIMVGETNGGITHTPLKEGIKRRVQLTPLLSDMITLLSA